MSGGTTVVAGGGSFAVIRAALRMGVLEALQYRVGFWFEGVLSIAWSLIGMAPLLVALGHRPEVAGWDAWSLVTIVGFYTLFSGIFGAFLEPAMIESMQRIRTGSFDYLLLRPVPSLLSALTSAFSMWRLVEILAGLALIVASAWKVGASPTLLDLVGAVAFVVAGTMALYAFGIFALAASFRALQLQNLAFLMEATLDFARWPISVFRGPLKALFTFVVPFAVMTTFPAESLLRGLGLETLAWAWVSAGLLLGAALWTWRRGLSRYTSASS